MKKSALNACHDGWGVLTLVGLANMAEDVGFPTFNILCGRSIKGTYFGGNWNLYK